MIKTLIQTATSHFCGDDKGTKNVTDFHIKVADSDGSMLVMDDEDNVLATAVVTDFVSASTETVGSALRNVLSDMNASGCFSNMSVFKPFSFLLEDAEGEMLSELFIVDDENIILTDDELLKGLDEELNDFLAKLLSE